MFVHACVAAEACTLPVLNGHVTSLSQDYTTHLIAVSDTHNWQHLPGLHLRMTM